MFQSILLFLSLLLIPTQLGLHFWPAFTYVTGFRIDYLSPTIYLVDILFLLYILSSLGNLIKLLSKNRKTSLIFLLIFIINVLFSISPLNTISWFTHLVVYILYVLSIKVNGVTLKDIIKPLLISVVFVIVLEIIQIINQGSIGGLIYWFGERTISISTPNIAKLEILGREFLRPYSTFSHPNSLAGYLFMIYLLLYKSKIYRKYQILIILGILLTLSKSVAICLVIFLVNIPFQLVLIMAVINTVVPVLPYSLTINWLPNYLSSRIYFASTAKEIIITRPIFGVGYGNYIPSLIEVMPIKYYKITNFQPVHNLIILLMTEFGLYNTIATLVIVLVKIKNLLNKNNLRYLTIILLLFTFDHYFYTLPQNKVILLISLLYLV